MVCITPNTAAAGCCGCGGDGAGATGIGADTAGGADGCVAGPGCCKRCPQCWQNEKPAGVCLPHDGHVTFPVDGDALAGADGAAASGAFAASEVPHILQKFIPAGLAVPQALQTMPLAAAGCDAAGLGAGAASRRWPQSWQKRDPSRLTFPQCEQRGIGRRTSRV